MQLQHAGALHASSPSCHRNQDLYAGQHQHASPIRKVHRGKYSNTENLCLHSDEAQGGGGGDARQDNKQKDDEEEDGAGEGELIAFSSLVIKPQNY